MSRWKGTPFPASLRAGGIVHTLWLLLGAFLCTWALLTHFLPEGLQAHLLFHAALFCLSLWVLHKGSQIRTVRAWLPCIVWGLLLALVFIVGQAYSQEERLLPDVEPAVLCFRILGLGLFFSLLAACAARFTLPASSARPLTPPRARAYFALCMGGMLLCWLPTFLYVFPGIYSTDTMVQYMEVIGFEPLSNAHPIVHTLLLKGGLSLGRVFGLSDRACYAAMTLGQMACLAAAFSYCALFVRTRFESRLLALGTALYFALFPLHVFYSMTLWKDIPFSACVLLLGLMLYDVQQSQGAVLRRPGFVLRLVLVSLGVLLLRNNGVLILLPSLLIFFFVLRPARKALIGLFCGLAGVYVFLHGFLLPWFSIDESSVAEMLSVPISQIGAIIQKDQPLTQEEGDLIGSVLPIEDIEELYSPRAPDSLKFATSFDDEALAANLSALGRVWIDLLREYPEEAALAYLHLEGGYLYPDHVRPWIVYYPNVTPENYSKELQNEPVVPALSWVLHFLPNEIIDRNEALGFFFRPGYLIWVYLLAWAVLLSARRGKWMLCLLPPLVLWLSLMLGAPLSDTRYAYPLFLLQPLAVGLCLQAKRPLTQQKEGPL